ncbi:hypothetical protein [Flavobacterium sp. KJJ]|uniref:hypothetical protein n=1 Tax=Flavobacterium sp. KJJ TaxID=1270193 RepID=UPI0004935114|nr:hypothetical protein [Flavobacterium sp. KJJ]
MGIFNFFKSKKTLEIKVIKIKKDIEAIVSEVCSENFSVLKYGAYEINPKYLVYWICVNTDEVRNKLSNDKILKETLRNVIINAEYPIEAVNDVFVGFESQETVDRESNGDWYLHFK